MQLNSASNKNLRLIMNNSTSLQTSSFDYSLLLILSVTHWRLKAIPFLNNWGTHNSDSLGPRRTFHPMLNLLTHSENAFKRSFFQKQIYINKLTAAKWFRKERWTKMDQKSTFYSICTAKFIFNISLSSQFFVWSLIVGAETNSPLKIDTSNS